MRHHMNVNGQNFHTGTVCNEVRRDSYLYARE